MRTTSRAIRVTCIALASALYFPTITSVPAYAAPDSNGQADARTDGLLIIRNLTATQGQAHKDHKDQIEILSWSWGESRPATHSGSGGMGAGKVSMNDLSATPAPSGEKGGTEDINIGVGELQEGRANDRLRNAGPMNASAAPGGVQVAAGDVTGDGTEAPRKPTIGRATISPKMADGGSEGVGGSPAASGLPTGKRQHKAITFTQPLDKGSVLLKLKAAWPECRVGATYPSLELSGSAKTYRLTDATVTDCAAAGGDRPTESISLNYTKIEF